eukprot:COSAG06_NODE_3752_length_4945_cov_5.541478_4_plen_60_part_00
MRWLRTELRTVPFLRSRAPGPMLAAPAGELVAVLSAFWPFARLWSEASALLLGVDFYRV